MSPLKANVLTERELVRGVLDGKLSYQKEFFERYAGIMMTVCRRYARHRLEAEDILQDAFIRAFQNLKQFNFKGSLEGWVRRIVINTALKVVAKKSFKSEIYADDYSNDQIIEPIAISNLHEEDILALIEELPHGYRVIFNMYEIEGFSHKEIAEMLSIKQSTSRSQLMKAKRLLQKKILSKEKLVS